MIIFIDTVKEREQLMLDIYPKLRSYCRHRYDIDIQFIDTRMDDIYRRCYDDHRLQDIILGEMQTSRQSMIGSYVVVSRLLLSFKSYLSPTLVTIEYVNNILFAINGKIRICIDYAILFSTKINWIILINMIDDCFFV